MTTRPIIELSDSEFKLAKEKASELVKFFRPKIEATGKSGSHIQDTKERLERLADDQITGQVAQLAGTLYLTGTDHEYRMQRWVSMLHPHLGDGGYDIPGLQLDFKGSRLKGGRKPHDYKMLVRPQERKPEWCYALAVVDISSDKAKAYMMGWFSDEEIKCKPQSSGLFAGAHVISIEQLHPLPTLNWVL